LKETIVEEQNSPADDGEANSPPVMDKDKEQDDPEDQTHYTLLPDNPAVSEEVDINGVKCSCSELFGTFRVGCFYFCMFVFGGGISVVGNFLFLHLLEDLHASHVLLGLTVLSTILMEVPVFHYSDKILDYVGIRGMIIIAHFAYILRVSSYYFLNEAWWVLPVEVSHGLTYALIWPAGVAYASRSVAPEYETTAQGLFSGVFGGIGSAAGALIGGFVYEKYGARILFLGSGCMMAINLVIFLITYQNPVKAYRRKLSNDHDKLLLHQQQQQQQQQHYEPPQPYGLSYEPSQQQLGQQLSLNISFNEGTRVIPVDA